MPEMLIFIQILRDTIKIKLSITKNAAQTKEIRIFTSNVNFSNVRDFFSVSIILFNISFEIKLS